MTALLSLPSLGLWSVMEVLDVSLRVVAEKLMAFCESSNAGRMPTPWQGILYVLRIIIEKIQYIIILHRSV